MPFGEIVAVPERGTMMGNRGVLHDAQGRIRRPWQVKRWLICLLDFKGRRRPLMAPNRYTELYFLDEATALAAGHRPCAECRRARFLAFRDAWASANGGVPPESVRVAMIDDQLHAERVFRHTRSLAKWTRRSTSRYPRREWASMLTALSMRASEAIHRQPFDLAHASAASISTIPMPRRLTSSSTYQPST